MSWHLNCQLPWDRRHQWSLQSQLVSQFEDITKELRTFEILDITHHFIHIQVFNTCALMFVIITLIGWRVIASANDACCFKTHVLVVTGNGCCLVALQHLILRRKIGVNTSPIFFLFLLPSPIFLTSIFIVNFSFSLLSSSWMTCSFLLVFCLLS